MVYALGYIGKGIVAIMDDGIDTDNLDLKKKHTHSECSKYIVSKYFCEFTFYCLCTFVFSRDCCNIEFLRTFAIPKLFATKIVFFKIIFIRHGDQCANTIGSVRGNGICTIEIFYNATIVGEY